MPPVAPGTVTKLHGGGGIGRLFAKPSAPVTQRKYSIKRFDPATMLRPNSLIMMNAKRRSGKSVFLEYLMYHMQRHIDLAIAMCPSKPSCDMFKRHIPDAFVYDQGYDATAVDDLVKVSKLLTEQGKPRNIQLYLDDCGCDGKSMASQTMKEIFMNGRHYNLGVTWCQQYLKSIPPAQRDQIDYIICFATNDIKLKKNYYETYFSIFPNFSDFCKVFDFCTKNYGVLILDNNANTGKDPLSCVYMGRADMDVIERPFRLGRSCYFEWSERYMRTREERWKLLTDPDIVTPVDAAPAPKKRGGRKKAPAAAPPPEPVIAISDVPAIAFGDSVRPRPAGHALVAPTAVCTMPILPPASPE